MPVLLLTLETLLFIAIDRKMYGTFYTPTIFLSVPYLCIVFVFILFADNFNFYSLYLPSVYIWCIGLALYWLVGYILSLCLLRKTINNKTPFKQKIYIPITFNLYKCVFLSFQPASVVLAVL